MAKKLYNDSKNGLHVKADNMPELRAALRVLMRDEVLVGYPEDTTERDDPESKAQGITNASLAYIHDNGAPEANIPARPFMIPGIEACQEQVTSILARSAQYVLAGNVSKVKEGFERVGLAAVGSIQSTIRNGIGPALAEVTLIKRAAKGRKGAQAELDRRAEGYAPGLDLATPLMDTNEMLKSTNYVVRNRNRRRK